MNSRITDYQKGKNMTIENIKNEIGKITDCRKLNELKECIINAMQTNLDRRENFMFRDYVDNVFYAIYFNDGRRNLQVIGSRAWRIFTENEDAVRIETITKNLYPTTELLIQK